MAINLASNLTAIANNFILAAKLTERDSTVMRPLVRVIPMKKGVNQIDLPKFGTVSVAALTDGVDLATPTSFTPSSTTFTASERGAMIVITDKAMRESQDMVGQLASRELGRAWGYDQDTQLFSNFDSFSASIGAAGTEITAKYILAGHALLHGNSTQPIPMDGKVSAVLHSFQAYELQSNLTLPGTSNVPTDLQNDLIKRLFVARIFEVDVFQSKDITVDGSDDAKGAMFHQDAIVLVEQQAMRVRQQRDESLRATEFVLVGDWGHGIWENEWGVELLFDAATPSGTTH